MSYAHLCSVADAVGLLRQQTLSVISVDISVDVRVDNVTLLLANFHKDFKPLYHGGSSRSIAPSISTSVAVRGRRGLTRTAAKSIVGLINFINSFAGDQHSSFAQREKRKLSSATSRSVESEDDVAILTRATSNLSRNVPKPPVILRSIRTFFTVVSEINQVRTSATIPQTFCALELLYVPWKVHCGRIWARRRELSALIGVVSVLTEFLCSLYYYCILFLVNTKS